MGQENDREHFEDYREQTRVKHEILEAYLGPYFQILGSGNRNLLYIDGFAGRGTYSKAGTGERFDGSPLRALKLISENETFSAKVSTMFIEADPVLYSDLEKAVTEFANSYPNIRKPICARCTFAEGVRELLDKVGGKLAPTFLFVDPCGVAGTCFETINHVMACKSSEAFIFFNIDGVRRIAGLDKLSDVLIELLGSKARAENLFVALQYEDSVEKREQMILQAYREALFNDMGVTYSVPFRVESEDKQKTSHYLIHATNHRLGFKIMKDVMWRHGHSDDRAGGLAFEQASRTNFTPLFDLGGDEVKHQILSALDNAPLKVAVICDDWVCRPDNMLCETAYKRALLELEAAGKIEVLSKDLKDVVTAAERPKRNKKPTLGNDYFLRLARSAIPK